MSLALIFQLTFRFIFNIINIFFVKLSALLKFENLASIFKSLIKFCKLFQEVLKFWNYFFIKKAENFTKLSLFNIGIQTNNFRDIVNLKKFRLINYINFERFFLSNQQCDKKNRKMKFWELFHNIF